MGIIAFFVLTRNTPGIKRRNHDGNIDDANEDNYDNDDSNDDGADWIDREVGNSQSPSMFEASRFDNNQPQSVSRPQSGNDVDGAASADSSEDIFDAASRCDEPMPMKATQFRNTPTSRRRVFDDDDEDQDGLLCGLFSREPDSE